MDVQPPADAARASTPAGAARCRGVALWCVALLLLACAGTLPAQVPPDARWRTLQTEHFRVNFMDGLDSLAHRTAVRAEWAYAVLAEELTDPPSGRIDIVLTDAVDLANGTATPLPTNRIVLYAHPPTDVTELSFTTDWLELLVVHELVHIFHLDQAGGIWHALRTVFGRNPATFPNALAPDWLIEGLATYYESALTPGGRVRGTVFDMMLRTAVLEGEFFSVDQASAAPRSWPGGSTRYLYGALFLDHLARRNELDGFGEFVERYGSQTIPYRLNRAAQQSVGNSFSDAWASWLERLRREYEVVADSVAARGVTHPELLTEAGREAFHPRYAPSGGRIAYSAATGRQQAAIRVIDEDGRERELAPRAQLGPLAWRPGGDRLLYGDLQFVDPYRIYADLWEVTSGGDERRLTRSARISQPDIHPDGETVIAVGDAGGSNVLVVGVPGREPFRPIAGPEIEVHWGVPRWSPSGDSIAAVRWAPGGLHDIVLLDRAGTVLREITRDRAVDGTPVWSPDGRYLLFWSDRSGIPNLYAHDLRDDRLLQVTSVVSGAFQPTISADQRWIAFTYYRSDGYHIARIPFDPAAWRPAPEPRPAALPLANTRGYPPVAAVSRSYSSWPTIAPAAWTLLPAGGTDLGAGLGVLLAGRDVVERHLWAGSAVAYEGGRFEGGGVYRYQGWGNPAVEFSAWQEWEVVCGEGEPVCGSAEPLPAALLRREREAGVSLLWVRQRMRSTAWLRPGVGLETRDLEWSDAIGVEGLSLRQVPPDVSIRLAAGRSSVRSFALSVGPQTGFSIAGTAEGHRYTRALGEESGAAGYLRTVLRGRAFRALPGDDGRHVLALRADGGAEFGSRSPGFDLGGASGGVLPLAVEMDGLGRGLAFPVRGYGEGAQFGNRVASASLEYRFPLLRVERGSGLFPLHLDRFTGDLFIDAGTAWCPGECPPRLAAAASEPDILSSVGGELVAELRFGFQTAVPLRFGVALPTRSGHAPQLYLRVGRSF